MMHQHKHNDGNDVSHLCRLCCRLYEDAPQSKSGLRHKHSLGAEILQTLNLSVSRLRCPHSGSLNWHLVLKTLRTPVLVTQMFLLRL